MRHLKGVHEKRNKWKSSSDSSRVERQANLIDKKDLGISKIRKCTRKQEFKDKKQNRYGEDIGKHKPF